MKETQIFEKYILIFLWCKLSILYFRKTSFKHVEMILYLMFVHIVYQMHYQILLLLDDIIILN